MTPMRRFQRLLLQVVLLTLLMNLSQLLRLSQPPVGRDTLLAKGLDLRLRGSW